MGDNSESFSPVDFRFVFHKVCKGREMEGFGESLKAFQTFKV
jgi:hypothetical protein